MKVVLPHWFDDSVKLGVRGLTLPMAGSLTEQVLSDRSSELGVVVVGLGDGSSRNRYCVQGQVFLGCRP
jgi:hypothetical protein